jgi:hypothetical protein
MAGRCHRCRNRHRRQPAGAGQTARLLGGGPTRACSKRGLHVGRWQSRKSTRVISKLVMDGRLHAEPTFYCGCTALLRLYNLQWCIHKASDRRRHVSCTNQHVSKAHPGDYLLPLFSSLHIGDTREADGAVEPVPLNLGHRRNSRAPQADCRCRSGERSKRGFRCIIVEL